MKFLIVIICLLTAWNMQSLADDLDTVLALRARVSSQNLQEIKFKISVLLTTTNLLNTLSNIGMFDTVSNCFFNFCCTFHDLKN